MPPETTSVSADPVEQLYRELENKGVRFTMKPEKQPWGGFMALFLDPDGNIFYLDQLRET